MADDTCGDDSAQARVVSLLSGLTEAVHLMGLGHLLVGRSHECDWPPDVLPLPQVSQPRVDPGAASTIIDAQVREAMQSSGTAYEMDAEQLKQLSPTVLIVQDSCRVCAVSPGDLENCGCDGLPSTCRVLTVFPKCLEDVFCDIQSVADMLGHPNSGKQAITQLRSRLQLVKDCALASAEARLRHFGPQPAPRVVVLEWCSPLMGCGYWIPELVRLAGAQCLFGGIGEHTEYISIQDITNADPDFIIFACCGFSVERSINEICQTTLLSDRLWKQIAAVRGNRVFVVDGNRYFNRSGPSVVDTAEIVSQILGFQAEQKYGQETLMPLEEAMAYFGVKPRPLPAGGTVVATEPGLPLEQAVSVVKDTVQALQEGTDEGVRKAYNNSAVSACMALELYQSTILQNPDYAPLSNSSLTVKYGNPRVSDSSGAKIQVEIQGDGGATYVFRMLVDDRRRKWMIEGVNKVS